jgi:hypothetical protein
MASDLIDEAVSFVQKLRGLRCWYVSTGGVVTPTFQLALGGKVRRARPINNRVHSEEYRLFEGEANLLVWCTWRLDGPGGPLTSSDDSEEQIVAQLSRLVDAKVRSASITSVAWDLLVTFWNGPRLRVFCDHVQGSPTGDGNWDLWRMDRALCVGPGSRMEFEPREEPATLRG